MSDERSKTVPEQRKVLGVPFAKGDKRINRKGRPKTFDGLRAEAIKIAGEILTSADKTQAISRAHAMLLDWATSKDVRKQQLFIEYAFGKVPTQTELSGPGGGPIETNNIRQDDIIAELQRRGLVRAASENRTDMETVPEQSAEGGV